MPTPQAPTQTSLSSFFRANFGSSLLGFQSPLCHLLAMGPQASVLASLICLICKMGVMNVTSQGFCEDEMNFIYNI